MKNNVLAVVLSLVSALIVGVSQLLGIPKDRQDIERDRRIEQLEERSRVQNLRIAELQKKL